MPCHPPFAIRIRVCTRPASAVYLIYVSCARGVSKVTSACRNSIKVSPSREKRQTREEEEGEESHVDEKKVEARELNDEVVLACDPAHGLSTLPSSERRLNAAKCRLIIA